MSNTVIGNMIGTNVSGTMAMGNRFGVYIHDGAHHNTIGADTPGARNLISGNKAGGLIIRDTGTDNNTVRGNYIGIGINGTVAISNGIGSGVSISDGASWTCGGI